MKFPLELNSLSSPRKDELILEQYNLLQEQSESIAKLAKEVEDLKNKLATNSRSSKPPSSDGYDRPKPKSQRKKIGRPSGGQPGHKGHTLKQVARADKIEEHFVNDVRTAARPYRNTHRVRLRFDRCLIFPSSRL